MKQIVQSVRNGDLRLVEVPQPSVGPNQILVATTYSAISAGTEKAVRHLASASLVAKAKARPELVRQVVRKARADGLIATMHSVQSRLDEDMPLGYSAVGRVIALGANVSGLRVGDTVATAGAGHAEIQLVAANLACRVPDTVAAEDAALCTIASIALHGLRLADLGPGSTVCVIGLGLLGQIACRLALASGYRVAGIDVQPHLVDRAIASGVHACVEDGAEATADILDWSRGRGVDAVLITAATPSSNPMRRAPALCRDSARIVLVGDVGMELERTPLYEKELSVHLARSYGPGRYDRVYEDWGVDYPVGLVRWPVARNLEAVLDLLAAGVTFSDLITHTFAIEDAESAYALLDSGESYLGVELRYDSTAEVRATRSVTVGARRTGGDGVGLIGAGTFVRATLMPALKQAGFTNLVAVTSQTGLSATHLAERVGFERVLESARAVVDDADVDAVFICTPHDSHAALVEIALNGGKHVFCEKPLALSEPEIDGIVEAWRSGASQLMVGFNRRYSPAVTLARESLSGTGPLMMTYRVNAGALPAKHWYHDRVQGGRLIGEVCHFIDTACAVAGSPVATVMAFAAGGSELALSHDLSVAIQFEDRSLATIIYAAGGYPGTEKERFEVLGRGHTVIIDDFRSLTVDGKLTKFDGQDKGHRAELEHFRRSIRLGDRGLGHTASALATMRATLAAVESLQTGSAVVPRRDLIE